MKKTLIMFVAVAALGLASCSSVRHTATTVAVETDIVSANVADLSVAPDKISYTLYPTGAMKRCGEKAVIKTAVAEALKANGNADVLVGFQYEIKKTCNIFGKTSIKYVTVEGYPGTYTSVRPVVNP